MSIVVWDGKVLAADMMATNAGLKFKVSKMRHLQDGTVLAWVGNQDQGLFLADWYENGKDVDKWPAFQSTPEWTRLIVAKDGVCWYYDTLPVAQYVYGDFAAFGSGRDFAYGAKFAGANAIDCVNAAIEHSDSCGFGVEV